MIDRRPPPPAAWLALARRACAAVGLALIALGVGTLTLSCCQGPRRLPEVPVLPVGRMPERIPATVPVMLTRSATELTVACKGAGLWVTLDEGAASRPVTGGAGPWTIAARDGALDLAGVPTGSAHLRLTTSRDIFRLGDADYRGALDVRLGPDARLVATDLVPPADYLRSVVGSEMYANWPLDALMAQAVTARTYMLYTLSTKAYLDRVDMAYRGMEAESRPTDLAVSLTNGIVLADGGRLFSAFFHSCCGGHTAHVDKVFPRAPAPPLCGVVCPWCEDSPNYRWETTLPAREVAESLRAGGVPLQGPLLSVEPLGRGADGYARRMRLNGTVEMDAYAFRLAVGAGKLRSVNFSVAPDGRGGLVFSGAGWGHGVGLCQWGARGQALDGRSWDTILRYYYPGADLVRIGGRPAD